MGNLLLTTSLATKKRVFMAQRTHARVSSWHLLKTRASLFTLSVFVLGIFALSFYASRFYELHRIPYHL
jgi:hypothetical protein